MVDVRVSRVSVVHISMVCIQAWFALKPDAESGLYAYKPGFYPRLYSIEVVLHIILIVDRFILMATNNGSSNFTDVFMS